MNASWEPVPASAGARPGPSIFNGKTLPDLIDPFVERIESGVKGPVVKVENIPACQKAENPVVSFHVDQDLLNRMTDKDNDVPQKFHRTPRFEKMAF